MQPRQTINPKMYFFDLPTNAPTGSETWEQVNRRFAERLRVSELSRSRPEGLGTTSTEDVIKFFSGGIRTNLFQNYVRYALNSLYRGAKFVNEMALNQTTVVRYLDVGCAYGGCPIVMAETNSALECVGLEYESRLLALAEKLAIERGVSDRVKFQTGDITVSESVAGLGKFDLITCLDVLEHVLDPAAAIACLSGLMTEGGTLRVDIPNKFSSGQIRSDPHHHLFGSILLPRADAIRVFEASFPGNKRYTVGFFHALEYYVEAFQSHGVSIEVIDRAPTSEQALVDTRDRFRALPAELERVANDSRWPRWRIDLISAKVSSLVAAVDSDLNRVYSGELDAERFQLRYSVPVFHLRCRRIDSSRATLPAAKPQGKVDQALDTDATRTG